MQVTRPSDARVALGGGGTMFFAWARCLALFRLSNDVITDFASSMSGLLGISQFRTSCPVTSEH